jgi:hypothetical protein
MGCLFREPKKARFISERLEDSLEIEEKEVKLIGVVLLLTELDIQCFTVSLEDH